MRRFVHLIHQRLNGYKAATSIRCFFKKKHLKVFLTSPVICSTGNQLEIPTVFDNFFLNAVFSPSANTITNTMLHE